MKITKNQIKRHILNGLEITDYEIEQYKNNPNYHNKHFLGEILKRFKQVSSEMKLLKHD